MSRHQWKVILGLAAAGLALPDAHAAQGGAVLPVQRRLDALKSAGEILAPRQPSWQSYVAELPDPFFRKNFVESQPQEQAPDPAAMRRSDQSDEEVLRAVAPEIAPTGTMLIGDEPYLLIGGRRFRVGDQISVTFGGMIHRISITSIERNSYTLQLNSFELRREFK